MSKLDDIMNQAADAIAKGVIQGDWKMLDTKQQIKDLMLELASDVSHELESDTIYLAFSQKVAEL